MTIHTTPGHVSLIRVSKMNGRKVDDDSTRTVKQQRDANLAVAEQVHSWLMCEFQALDQSGATITESKAWREALAMCQRGQAKGIVLAWGDRLTRDLWRVGAYLSELQACNAEILIAGMPGVDYRTPMGRNMLNQVLAMADYQYQLYRERGMKTIEAMLKDKVPNAVPYGYRRNNHAGPRERPELADKALVLDPDRAPIVRMIYAWRTLPEPLSWHAIADELNRIDAPRPSAKAQCWHTGSLTRIVHNRAYLGEVNFSDTRIPDAHEPIIARTIWEAAQSKQPVARNGRLSKVGLGLGIMRCSSCGGTLSMKTTSQKHGGWILYSCRRRKPMCDKPTSIMHEVVDKFLEGWICDALNGKREIALFTAAHEIEDARRALDNAVIERDELVDRIGSWSPQVIDRAMGKAEAIVTAAREHYDELLSAQEAQAHMPQDVDGWHALTLEAKREVLARVIERIDVLPPFRPNRWGDPIERLSLVERGCGGQ